MSRELAKRRRFRFGVDVTENMDIAVGEKHYPPLLSTFWGVYSFLSNALFRNMPKNTTFPSDVSYWALSEN